MSKFATPKGEERWEQLRERRNMGHTPGPWTLGENNSYFGQRIYGGESISAIANVNADGEEGEANAHLIAAAPELLEHLKMAKALLMESDLKPANVCADIEEVIAKAERRK